MASKDGARRSAGRLLIPRRLRIPLLVFAIVVAIIYVFFPKTIGLSRSKCSRHPPRLISHRGFDSDTETHPSATSVAALIDGGVASFDVDLFWMATNSPGGSPLFVGHPPTTRALWQLPTELVDTPLEQLRTSVRVAPDSKRERITRARARAVRPPPSARVSPELSRHRRTPTSSYRSRSFCPSCARGAQASDRLRSNSSSRSGRSGRCSSGERPG